MFKCFSCKKVFDEADVLKESHGFTDGFYEDIAVCPHCGGDFDETESCKECGHDFLEDELFYGLCVDCLKESATYEICLEFMTDDWSDSLDVFMFEKVFEVDAPKKRNEKMDLFLRKTYLQMVEDEKLAGSKTFLKMVQDFVIDGDGDYGKESFAEFLNEKRKAVKE